jgi:hypothetical protein
MQQPPWQPAQGQSYPGQPQQGQPQQGQPQQPYGAAPNPMVANVSNQAADAAQAVARGFFGALFDFGFNSFIATRLVKVLYVLVILASLGVLVTGIFGGLSEMFSTYGKIERALQAIAVAPFAAVLTLLAGRLYLEIMVVLFRVSESLQSIDKKTR